MMVHTQPPFVLFKRTKEGEDCFSPTIVFFGFLCAGLLALVQIHVT